jgi:peptidoglycan/xylan/chitin deacetylase (PgdA/CDA1 family)
MSAMLRKVVRRLQTLVPSLHSGAMILAYHLVGARTSSPVDLPPDLFEAHLDSLAAPVVSLDAALEQLNRPSAKLDHRTIDHGTVNRSQKSEVKGQHMSNGKGRRHSNGAPRNGLSLEVGCMTLDRAAVDGSQKSEVEGQHMSNGECRPHSNHRRLSLTAHQQAVLTFDDAYANFYEQVYPRLVERRLPALLYVATGFIDGDYPVPIRGTERLAPCTWDQLREMAASGLVTLGSHTVTHPSLTHVGHDQAAWELWKSKARIEQMTGEPVRHFCYPRGLWNRRLEHLVGEHYTTATIGGGSSITHGYNPLRLQRTSLRNEFDLDLTSIVRSRVCLEECLANVVRRWRDRFQSRDLGFGINDVEALPTPPFQHP